MSDNGKILVKCQKCPIQDDCEKLNRALDSGWSGKYMLCPLVVAAKEVFKRYREVARAEVRT